MDLITDILDILRILYPELNITAGQNEIDSSPTDLGLVSELMVNNISVMWVYSEGYVMTSHYTFPGQTRHRRCKTLRDKEKYLHNTINFFNKEMASYSFFNKFKPINRREMTHESK